MEYGSKIAFGLLVMAAGFAASLWLGWRFLKKSYDPGKLLVKWIMTGLGLTILLWVANTGIIAVLVAAVLGIILGIMWAPNLGAMLAAPLTSFYDGGDIEPEARPFYSIANAKRKQGKFEEAIHQVKEQLHRFPQDYEGWLMLAEIYGENLKDNGPAQSCVEEIIRHGNHAPKNIAFALTRSSDWHLALASDREAAKESLIRITELLPDTEQAQIAWQRIAHLSSDKILAEQKNRPTIVLTRHEGYVGLQGAKNEVSTRDTSPEEEAARLVQHLNEHPFDTEAREQLAIIYADHYGRLDLAADQMEQLIASPNPQQKQVVHWLNLLGDLHIRVAGDRAAAEAAVKRILERFPNTAAAANAEKRVAYMDLELNKKTKSQAIKLGSYQQNIGLQGQVPRQP